MPVSQRQIATRMRDRMTALADVEPAGCHAPAVGLAGCPVRYVAPAPDQTCRQGRGAQAKGSAPPATVDAEPADLRLPARPAAANAHLSWGPMPRFHPLP